jgi:hypothetical protein
MELIKKLLSKKKKEIQIYKGVIICCIERLVDMIFCARFMFFAIVTSAIGTTGIWVPVLFQIELSPLTSVCNSLGDILVSNKLEFPEDTLCVKPRVIGLENFSMFMYVVGVLGMLAADFFIKGKSKNIDDDPVQLALLSFCMLIWFLALALSFWGLKVPTGDSWHLKVSIWLTISLWLSSIYTDNGFDRDDSRKRLAGDTPRVDEKLNTGNQFNGDGLDE